MRNIEGYDLDSEKGSSASRYVEMPMRLKRRISIEKGLYGPFSISDD